MKSWSTNYKWVLSSVRFRLVLGWKFVNRKSMNNLKTSKLPQTVINNLRRLLRTLPNCNVHSLDNVAIHFFKHYTTTRNFPASPRDCLAVELPLSRYCKTSASCAWSRVKAWKTSRPNKASKKGQILCALPSLWPHIHTWDKSRITWLHTREITKKYIL